MLSLGLALVAARARADDPTAPPSAVTRLEAAGQFDDAATALLVHARAPGVAPTTVREWVDRAVSHRLALGDMAGTTEALDTLAAADPSQVRVATRQLELGEVLARAHRWAECVVLHRRWLQRYGRRVDAALRARAGVALGDAWYAVGLHGYALGAWQEVRSVRPPPAITLANALGAERRAERTRETFARTLPGRDALAASLTTVQPRATPDTLAYWQARAVLAQLQHHFAAIPTPPTVPLHDTSDQAFSQGHLYPTTALIRFWIGACDDSIGPWLDDRLMASTPAYPHIASLLARCHLQAYKQLYELAMDRMTHESIREQAAGRDPTLVFSSHHGDRYRPSTLETVYYADLCLHTARRLRVPEAIPSCASIAHALVPGQEPGYHELFPTYLSGP